MLPTTFLGEPETTIDRISVPADGPMKSNYFVMYKALPMTDSWLWYIYVHSGQIIATSHDLTPNGGLVREMGPIISGKSRLVKYCNLASYMNG